MMFFQSLFATLLVSATTVKGQFKPAINNTLEKGVQTECKTCPYTLCTNKAFYTYTKVATLECWTTGDSIGNDTTWLRTSDGCYVTQYDLADYNGTYEDDLSFCGIASTEEHLTLHPTIVQYDSECNICPDNGDCVTTKYISAGTEVIATCWTSLGTAVLGDFVWVKTIDNCYVSETGLLYPADRFILANCGPIGFLQVNYTGDYDVSHTARIGKAGKSSKAVARSPIPLPEPIEETDVSGNFLINITVGNDHADCRSCANITCGVQERYHFNETVLAQCYQETTSANPNETYWYETTDFCFVKTVDFWQSLDDEYNFPSCDYFKGPK